MHKVFNICIIMNGHRTNLDGQGLARTLESLRQAFTAWVNSRTRQEKAKHYGNVIHMPILSGDPDTLVIDILPPPELHLLLGVVGTLFKGKLKNVPVCVLGFLFIYCIHTPLATNIGNLLIYMLFSKIVHLTSHYYVCLKD